MNTRYTPPKTNLEPLTQLGHFMPVTIFQPKNITRPRHITTKRLPRLRETEVVAAGGDCLEQLATESLVAFIFGEIEF